MAANRKHIKVAAIHLAAEEIATAVQSVDTIANRCWRKNIISEQVYKVVLRPHPSIDPSKKVQILLEAVEASIREEEVHFGEFLDILGNELEPQVAKELISKITYYLEETRERTNLDQCTEDTQDELDHGQIIETSDTPFAQVSKDPNLSAGNNDSTSSASSMLRKRKQGTHTGLHHSDHDETPKALYKHTGAHSDSGSAEVEPVQATSEMPHTSDLHTNTFQQSNDVEPVQATDETTPSLLDCSLRQRQEMLRRLQDDKFAQYDKLQTEANNQVLTDENKSLKRQLEQQSIDHSHICDEKKKLEKELSDKRLKVDQLLAERNQRIASHRYDLEQLRNQVAENEKERNELEVRGIELEQRIKEITEAYDSRISQYQREIQALQEELDATKSIVDDQSSTISEQQREIRRLSSSVFTLQDKFKKKCTEFDNYRHRAMEFKSDVRALIAFVVVFIIFMGVVEISMRVVLIVGLFKSLF